MEQVLDMGKEATLVGCFSTENFNHNTADAGKVVRKVISDISIGMQVNFDYYEEFREIANVGSHVALEIIGMAVRIGIIRIDSEGNFFVNREI